MAVKQQKAGRRHVGPNIVRAWFDTVINPVLRGIRYELDLIDRRDWTWRFQPGRLEAIRAVRDYVAVDARDNLHDFLGSYPGVSDILQIHDETVQQLGTACVDLQGEIVEGLKTSKICDKLIAAEALSNNGGRSGDPFVGDPNFLREYLLAQYIINNMGELSTYYTAAQLWNHHRDELFALLNEPQVHKVYQRTLETAELLRKADVKSDQALAEARERLSRRHDVPFVSTSALLA